MGGHARVSTLRTIASVAFAAAAALTTHGANAASLGYGHFLGEFTGNPLLEWKVEDALTPMPFPTLDLHYLGSWSKYTELGEPDFTVNVTAYGKKIGGDWDYDGFATWTKLFGTPGQDDIQLFLALQYDDVYSVPSATGAPLSTGSGGKPYGLNYAVAYWADTPAPVPVPPAIALLLTGIGALFGIGRRKRTTTATATAATA
jgi:hypothetical protein